jgi:flavin reductase (DIM6/NTAB) family NADH-FMN oxidoreductase RutF
MGSQSLSDFDFRRACAQFATGVAIAAVSDPAGTPHSLTINSFTSVSLEPPLVLICIDNRATMLNWFERMPHFGISILGCDQVDLSSRFAMKHDDRFDGVRWRSSPAGAPWIEEALANLESKTIEVIAGGDHKIFLAEVTEVRVFPGEPLLYFGSSYRKLAEGV